MLGLQAETLQDRVFRADLPGRQRLGAITDHHRRFAVAAAIVLPHSLRVSDYTGGRKGRKKLTDGKDNPRQRAPLFALAVETIHVQDHRLAEEAGNPGHGAVGDVAHEHNIGAGEDNVQDREKGMHGRV